MSKKRKRRTVKIAVSIVLAVLLFSLIIFSLYKIDFMGVLEFIPSVFEKDRTDPPRNHFEKIKEIIELLEKNEGGYESVEVDPASVMTMLSSSLTKESYYHAYSVTYTHGEDVLVKNVFVTKGPNTWTVISREENASHQTVDFDGNRYLVRDDLTGEERIYSKDSGMSFEGQTYLTPISEIRALLSEYEAATDLDSDSRISGAVAELIRTQTDNIVLLNFKYDSTGQTEEYMIHLDCGVILSASISMNGEVYYKVTTSVFNPEYKTD